jgi:hypothetical protein
MIEVRPHEICVTEASLKSIDKVGKYTFSFDFMIVGDDVNISNKKILPVYNETQEIIDKEPETIFGYKYGSPPTLIAGGIALAVFFVVINRIGEVTQRPKRKSPEWEDSNTGEFIDDYADGKEGLK